MKIIITTILFFLTITAKGSDHENMVMDPVSVHGMVIFGKGKIYLSHLPMFHNPHDYQVLLEIELSKSILNEYQKLVDENKDNPLFTIVPEPFSLPDILEGLTSFKSSLFLGHFERGGKLEIKNFTVNIKKVLYFKKLDDRPVIPEDSFYFLINNKNESFLVHEIIGKPNFDYISKVKVLNSFKKSIRNDFTKIILPKNTESPKKGDIVNISIENNGLGLELEVLKNYYLEHKDLSF